MMTPTLLFLYIVAVACGLGVLGLVALALLSCFYALRGASQRALESETARAPTPVSHPLPDRPLNELRR